MTTILNDLHIGAIRSAGTTISSAWSLRQYLINSLRQQVDESSSLIVLGDLFDTSNVPMHDFFETWEIFRNHCANGTPLTLVAGNHDLSKNTTVLSSFQLLCKMLSAEFPSEVKCVFEPTRLYNGMYIIPHLPNQDLFNLAIAAVPPCDYLLLHCNYDNKFAIEADHSLNLSVEQAMKLPVKQIIIAHEHQGKRALNGKVLIPGNQFPSSVADCLGNDHKFRIEVVDKLKTVETWSAVREFAEIEWRALVDTRKNFIRVTGTATENEAAEVVQAIAKFRSKSEAFVITNAVKIEGIDDAEQIALSVEEVKAFDVMEAVMELLDEREQEIVKKLYERKVEA